MSTIEESIEVNAPLRAVYHRIDDSTTRVRVQMDFVPEGIKERIGDALGAADRRVHGDLERFKELVETSGAEGGWRGEIERPDEG